MEQLKNIEDLYFIKKSGLIEICKYNRSLISGYWDLSREDIIGIFKQQLEHNHIINIPFLDIKYYSNYCKC
jgi:hypothetical protein